MLAEEELMEDQSSTFFQESLENETKQVETKLTPVGSTRTFYPNNDRITGSNLIFSPKRSFTRNVGSAKRRNT